MFSDSPLVWGQVKGKFATKGLVNYTSLGGRGKGKREMGELWNNDSECWRNEGV